MNQALDLFKQMSVGFDDSWLPETRLVSSYPLYNIVKQDDNQFNIEIALAGWAKDDLEIYEENGKLTIAGNRTDEDKEEQQEFVHRGVARRKFTRVFNLAPDLEVDSADFSNGMLVINLLREPHKNQKTISIS